MLFQQIDRTDPEKVFGIFYSVAGVAKDAAVCLDTTSLADGIAVIQPTTAGLAAFVGIVDKTIAATSYGLVQLYGYRASSQYLATNTSVAAGVPLIAANGADSLVSTSGNQYVVLLESKTSSSGTVSLKIHIRAM